MRRFMAVLFSLSPTWVVANDFPTLDRVDQVLTCMARHGGQTLDNLYACSCTVDAIAADLSYDDFIEAATFRSMRPMPGEGGGLFRDSKRGQALIGRLEAAERSAEAKCFVAKAHAARKTGK